MIAAPNTRRPWIVRACCLIHQPLGFYCAPGSMRQFDFPTRELAEAFLLVLYLVFDDVILYRRSVYGNLIRVVLP